MSTALARAWDELSREHHTGEGWSVRALHHVPCKIHAAMAHPSRMPGLILEVTDKAIPKGARLPTGKGFQVTASMVGSGSTTMIRIALELNDQGYSDVFTALVEDVLAAIAAAPDEPKAVKAFIGRLEAWQLFMQHHADGLSTEQQTGLFAEVSVLLKLAGWLGAGSGVVDSWVGPNRALHDFDFGPCHLEVKSGTGQFHVSAMAQLDETTVEHLILCHCEVIASNNGVTLPDLIDSARSGFATDQRALDVFNGRLHSAGYSDAHQKQYAERKLSIRQMRFFRVQAGFPRILASSVAAGIAALEYRVDLRACTPFEIDQQAALGYLSPSKADS